VVTLGLELPTEDTHCGVVAALTPEAVLRACREQLTHLDSAERRTWQHCRAIEALYHPGLYVRIAYVLLSDEGTPPDRYWPESQIVYIHWPARQPMSRRGTLAQIDGCDVEVYCFPNDRRLRGLRKFAPRDAAGTLFREWFAQSASNNQSADDSLRRVLIRYVPEQKLVARLRGAGSDEDDRCNVAVRCAMPKVARTLAARHRAVAPRVADDAKYLYVPRLIGSDDESGLLAIEWVRGRGLLEKLHSGAFERVMRRMAQTIRAFHLLPAEGLELDELRAAEAGRRTEGAAIQLGTACPDLAPRLTALAAELRRGLTEAGDVRPVTLHNDLHWDQVRIRQRRYALLDLERMCLGDPLIDVANFATQVRMLGLRPEYETKAADAERWAHEFLQNWATTTGEPVVAERFHLHAAASLLTLAAGMMRHLRSGWPTLTRRCVEQAEAELDAIGREVGVP